MKLRNVYAAAAALSLASAPAVAEVSFDRATAPVEGESEIVPPVVIGVLAVAVIIGAVVILADEEDEPASF